MKRLKIRLKFTINGVVYTKEGYLMRDFKVGKNFILVSEENEIIFTSTPISKIINNYTFKTHYNHIEYYIEYLDAQDNPIIDVKYIGVPNICFSLTEKNDKRETEYSKQRIKYGFDDSETWSLKDTIANFIIPRLERYEEIARECIIREPELVEDINVFLNAMRLVARDNGNSIWNEEEELIVTKGLENFPKIFLTLWW